MQSGYSNALDVRNRWLRWTENSPEGVFGDSSNSENNVISMYHLTLKNGPTYYMNSRFCQLVDEARRTMPNDVVFEPSWIQSPVGWLYLEEPAELPNTLVGGNMLKEGVRLRAIGWMAVEESTAYEFLCFVDRADYRLGTDGYFPWAYFGIRTNGERLHERTIEYENQLDARFSGDRYDLSIPNAELLHEIRWVFAAFHLMSQRLATTVEHPADRNTRRRMEREQSPHEPAVKIITLRRMEQERIDKGVHHAVDYQWQWLVGGHWRNQWYPSAMENRPKFIESYVKGPEDKPFKQPTPRLYIAKR